MINYFMVALAAFLAGAFIGGTLVFLRNKKPTRANVASTTWFLFRLFSMSAVSWVYISYAIAIYSTVKLGQVYGTELRSFSLPVRPRRCDQLRLKLQGTGMCKLYSITKTLEKGSELP